MNEIVRAVYKAMEQNGADTFLVTGFDPHISEYSAEYWQTRRFVSGFSGSCGFVVFDAKKNACLITDGRYCLQAKRELYPGFEIIPAKTNGEDELIRCLRERVNGGVLCFDFNTVSHSLYEAIENGADAEAIIDLDIAGGIWTARPKMRFGRIYEHDGGINGRVADKLEMVREELEAGGLGACFVSAADDAAWLFNIRGEDMPYSPLPYAYGAVTDREAFLFINTDSADTELKRNLAAQGVTLREYGSVIGFKPVFVRKAISVDPKRLSEAVFQSVKCNYRCVTLSDSIVAGIKAIKSESELRNIAECFVRDSAAFTKVILWFKRNAGRLGSLRVYEHDIHNMLCKIKETLPGYIMPAFQTIAALNENAALMHYSPVENGDKLIESDSVLLIDAGAHYQKGTTDITRALILGNANEDIKRDFTLVLKSHIALIGAAWREGQTGAQLDAFARAPMREHNIDYASGTGHGLGYCLCVHELYARISKTCDTVIKESMVLTVEPGIYREGKWGVRTENAAVVARGESEGLLKFEPLSFCPIDLDGVIPEMLTQREKEWLNAYHKAVFEKNSPFLDSSEKEELSKYTRGI